jgi:hypothetical protein
MKAQPWFRAVLAGAAILAVSGGVAVAQSEMTDKIRLECAAGSAACPGTAAQFDFSVSGAASGELGVRKVGAANDALHINNNGRVGINTNNALAPLHIFGVSGADVFNAVGPDPTSNGTALNFGYAGASFGQGAGFFNVRPSPGATAPNPSIRFATANLVRMQIDASGNIAFGMNAFPANGVVIANPLQHTPSGAHLTAGGVWTNASSRDLKENIAPLSLSEARDTLLALEPVKYDYKVQPGDERVGFIAEDVPALVAEPDHKTLSSMDIVGVLTKVVQDQQKAIAELRAELDALKNQQ